MKTSTCLFVGNAGDGRANDFLRTRSILRDCGFRIAETVGTRFSPLERNPVTRRIDGLFCSLPTFASGVIVVAQT